MVELRKHFGGLGNRMFQLAYIWSQFKKGEIPDIYLQDEKYFENAKEDIKAIFSLDIQPSNYISLHIRRGDYINNNFYIDLTYTDYYDKAIAEFPHEQFLVFCADRQGGSNDERDQEWVMNWLKEMYGDKFILNKGDDEVEDFNRMAGCKGHIMANSSFSWWASYIGEGKVVAPLQWFADGISRVKLLDIWVKF